MLAIECTFYHPTIAAANAQKLTWAGKPGYLGGYTRTGVPNSPIVADLAVGFWAVAGNVRPNPKTLPTNCVLVELDQPSLNFVLGIL